MGKRSAIPNLTPTLSAPGAERELASGADRTSPDTLAPAVLTPTVDASGSATDLPHGWVSATLSDVAEINPATDFGHLASDAELPFIPMAAVAEESGAIDISRWRQVDAVRKGYVRFREGDVIFAKITPCMENGKTAPVLVMPGGVAAGSTEFHVLRPGCVDAIYLWYWLVRRAFRQEAERNMSGSAGQLRVPADYLRQASIPIAPLPEQRRIVARIDELFAEIAEGEAALARARKDLGTWRRSLLKAAVTGELTRDWREANRPTETGADLLARIRNETANSIARRGRRRASAEPVDTALLTELPGGWVWARLGELGEIVGGVTVDKKREPAEPIDVPYLRVANVQRGHLNLGEIKLIRVERSVAERLALRINDVLLNEGGDRDKIGRGWVWLGEVPGCIHQNHVFRVRLHDDINPFLVSHYAKKWVADFSWKKASRRPTSPR